MPARLKAFLEQEMEKAARQLGSSRGQEGESPVHEARKSIKKLRAGLRLALKMLPETTLRRVEAPLRTAAQVLGPLRDHEVLKATVRGLRKRVEPKPEEGRAPGTGVPVRKAREALRKAEEALGDLPWAEIEIAGWQAGMKRLYKRGAKAMGKAEAGGSDDALHTWRRRVKDFYYALGVAEEEIVGGSAMLKKTGCLADYLGDDHDLAFFGQRFSAPAEREKWKSLIRRAQKRRRRLQKKAFAVGEKLFGRSPKEFAAKLG